MLSIHFLKSHIIILFMALLMGCEKDIKIDLEQGTEQIVVEGHIEPGLPPYILLTKSQPYFSPIGVEEINDLFIHHAYITVSNKSDTVSLVEIFSDSIPSSIAKVLSDQIGVMLAGRGDTAGFRFSVYSTLDPRMFGQIGATYNLNIQVGNKNLYSSTTIPKMPSLDSVWITPHPTDCSLVALTVQYTDPPGEDNFIRYFTSTNSQPFYPPYFRSLLDDKSMFNVDGKSFSFSIQKGQNRLKGINIDTFTYFSRGDSVVIRWCAVDKAHFQFWNTAEYDRGSTGNPFSSPVKISSNIQGGLGIWGGYSPFYYPINIP